MKNAVAVVAVVVALGVTALVSSTTSITVKPDRNALPPRITTTACGGGLSAVNYHPGAGFDPLTATDAELLANGYPPRPADSRSLAAWLTYVRSPITRNSSCANLVDRNSPPPASTQHHTTGVPTQTAGYQVSHNWAGNVATGHAYTSVYASWTLPGATSHAPGGSYSYSVDWVGLNTGQSSRALLLQAGSQSDAGAGGRHVYRLWLEAYPILPKQNLNGGGISAGDRLFIHVSASRSRALFHMVDMTIGFNQTYVYTHALPVSHQAEWILERPAVGGRLPYLAASSVRFRNSQASGPALRDTPVGRLPHHGYRMYTCDRRVLMAVPGSIAANRKDFTVRFQRPGGGRADSGCG